MRGALSIFQRRACFTTLQSNCPGQSFGKSGRWPRRWKAERHGTRQAQSPPGRR
jgi:hypothetical protein